MKRALTIAARALTWLSDRLSPDRLWLAARKQRVIKSCQSPSCSLAGRPYVEDGGYMWRDANTESLFTAPVKLDFYWPEALFAIKVVGRHHAPYTRVKASVPSRKFWETAVSDDFHTVEACISCGLPLLVIGPDDPVDPHAIPVAIIRLLQEHARK